jgi:hypothetical protein
MAKITGADRWKRRLQRLRGAPMVRHVTQAIFASAQDLVADAATSITAGATSGKSHEPSAPGTPPNADTHVLDRNIEAVSSGPLKAEASSNAPYAAAQEYGDETLGLPERPYMRPAAKLNRPKARRRVVAAVNKVVAASGG